MAREPVAREPVEREPVSIHALEPETPGRTVGQTPVKARPMPPLDEDGWRECARADCGQKFAPEPLSRVFCSDECAQINFYREHGMEQKAAAMMATEKRDDDGNIIRKERQSSSPEAEVKKEARYGPMREVDRVLSESKGRKRVVFKVCGHEQSVTSDTKRTRCRKCRNAAAKKSDSSGGVDVPKKVVRGKKAGHALVDNVVDKIISERPKREPVRREPVSLALPETEMMTPEEFVERGRAAQKALDKVVREEKKKLVKRKPVAKKKPVRKNPIKPKRRKK